MSFLIDPERLRDQQLILHYVLECRGSGHFLPYTDHAIIDHWLKVCPDADRLLLTLADHLPDYYAKHASKPVMPSLKGISRKIQRCLLNQSYGASSDEQQEPPSSHLF